MSARSRVCPYCRAQADRVTRHSNFKHYWFLCRDCRNLTREGKTAYPTDWIVRALSVTTLGRKIANRLIPYDLRRTDSDRAAYATYGEYFAWILDSQTRAAGFVEIKRQTNFKGPETVRETFAAHGIASPTSRCWT